MSFSNKGKTDLGVTYTQYLHIHDTVTYNIIKQMGILKSMIDLGKGKKRDQANFENNGVY